MLSATKETMTRQPSRQLHMAMPDVPADVDLH